MLKNRGQLKENEQRQKLKSIKCFLQGEGQIFIDFDYGMFARTCEIGFAAVSLILSAERHNLMFYLLSTSYLDCFSEKRGGVFFFLF